jgi:hypothetical protein
MRADIGLGNRRKEALELGALLFIGEPRHSIQLGSTEKKPVSHYLLLKIISHCVPLEDPFSV